MMEADVLVIRADAGSRIGTGHVMRCLALAQAWQNSGGSVSFVMATNAPDLEARLRFEEMVVINLSTEPGSLDDACKTIECAQAAHASWVVLDGYHFDSTYQRIVKQSGWPLLVVDDYGHADHYYADFVLNQNVYAHQNLYSSREKYTHLLLGPHYVFLRREFVKYRRWERTIVDHSCKLLVTLGGADPENVTLRVVRALEKGHRKDLEVVVVAGASYPHYENLRRAVKNVSFSVRVPRNVENMPELAAWADIAITGGGTTTSEFAFMGLPSLVLVLAENQRLTAEWLAANEIAIHVQGVHLSEQLWPALERLSMVDIRQQMSVRGRRLVDGRGSDRVLEQLRRARISLRPAYKSDCELLWKWANEPEVRSVSFSPAHISWEHHVEWFNQKITDPGCTMYIALNERNRPVGQVRFEIEANEAVISVSLDRNFRGRGYGSALIGTACRELFTSSNINSINAYVKPGNELSIRAFRKAGFADLETKLIRGCEAWHLVLPRKVS
jgi:UDP-2,4-diacetamido-2,4,6-trideoxy-beta-L-altropyranose hydrolase